MKINKSFKDLIIWQKGQMIFEMVCDDVKKWSNNSISSSIAYQLIASSGSISSNIAEGYGRGSPKEFEQFLRFSRGSCAETDNWIYKATQQRLINQSRYQEYQSIIQEIYKMTASFVNRLRNQKKRA